MGHESIAGDLESCLKEKKVEFLTSTELVVVGDFVFPGEFCAYQGHFPGQPILPAIVQLAAARFLAEATLKISLFPVQLSKVKFKGMVQPDDKIKVYISLTKENLFWQGKFELQKNSGQLLTSGSITLKVST